MSAPVVAPCPWRAAPAASAPALAGVPAKPTHVVIQPSDVFAAPNAAAAVQRLAPGTLVAPVRTEAGWVLIAKDGKRLGCVAAQGLAPMQ